MLAAVTAGALVLGALLGWALERSVRKRILDDLARKLLPSLERRAVALGIPITPSSEVQLAHDGDLEVRAKDAIAQVHHLIEAIDDHERAQLGFLDTMRVSKDEVDDSVRERQRAKGNG